MSDMLEAPQHPIDIAVRQRMSTAKSTAWLLWLFLGGVWANVAYLNPKHRTMIIVLGVVGLFVSFGIAAIIGILFGWIANLGPAAALEAEIRREEEEKFLRSHQIGGTW